LEWLKEAPKLEAPNKRNPGGHPMNANRVQTKCRAVDIATPGRRIEKFSGRLVFAKDVAVPLIKDFTPAFEDRVWHHRR